MQLEANGGRAPAQWQFDKNDWWVEEHGLIMEKPHFPIPPGKYMVTGGREVTTILTIQPDGGWELEGDVTLYDVTHLPCRSARYIPTSSNSSPTNANPGDFPVSPGSAMPAIEGYLKQDYAGQLT